MVKIEDIKRLREATGAGVADCRQVLEEAKGDISKATELLQKRGLEKADKKASRETHQGRVFSYVHATGKIGVVLTLLCETDFVARTEEFQALGRELCLQVASMAPTSVKELLKQEYIRDQKITIDAMIKSAIGKLGENIKLDGFSRLTV